MKSRIVKTIRNVIASIVILLLIASGGGIAYTWYTGQHESDNSKAFAAPVELKDTPVIKHTQPADNARESVSVQMITSPVIPGSNGSIIVRTNPYSICSISVIYDKTASADSGLANKTADDFGMISWTWTIESSVPLGKWPVKVTCTHNKLSAVVISDLVVAASIDK